jgi:sterol desaturase/sphingolipid hydroxylase (fatty acid hydroxylase superfamily)
MGWFLEIFFAYIAAVVFSVYLIKASRLSRKGKFLGNQLYVAMVQSLSTVGAFMSILAVLLFLILWSEQIFVISYFVVYFLMVSIFFVLFLDIFEPFSMYLLIKIMEIIKEIRTSFKRFTLGNTVNNGCYVFCISSDRAKYFC